MIKAVIFDMDGLMIETEHLQSKAFEHVLKSHGVTPQKNADGVIQKVGITAADNLIMLKQKHNMDENVETLLSKKQAIYKNIITNNIKPTDGLFSLITLLKKHGLTLAVGSSSDLQSIHFVLETLGIRQDFTAIVSGETVAHGKPFPDIFLKAAQDLHVDPTECLVLEDAQSGVEAAYRAGMHAIAVPNAYTKSHDFSKADLIVPSLGNINLIDIQNLGNK